MTMIRCIQYIHPPSNSHNMPPASQVRNGSEGTFLRKTTRTLPFLVGNPTEKTFICTTVDLRYPRYHNPMISIGISATSEAIIERTRSSAVGQAQWNHLFQMTDVLYLPKIQQMVVFYKMRLWLLVVFWTSANGGFLWGLCLFDIVSWDFGGFRGNVHFETPFIHMFRMRRNSLRQTQGVVWKQLTRRARAAW